MIKNIYNHINDYGYFFNLNIKEIITIFLFIKLYSVKMLRNYYLMVRGVEYLSLLSYNINNPTAPKDKNKKRFQYE